MKKLIKCQNVSSSCLTRIDLNNYFFFKSSSKIFYVFEWPKQGRKELSEPICKELNTLKKDIVYFKECPSGYFDENCSKVCEYPAFGKRCANRCSCEKHLCSFLLGCTNGKYSLVLYMVLNSVCNFTFEKCCHFNFCDSYKLIKNLLLTHSFYIFTMFTMKEIFQVNIQN